MTSPAVTMTSPYPARVTDELREAARRVPGGWVYVVDPQVEPGPAAPEYATLGAWDVDGDGALTGVFRENPEYRPSPVALGRHFTDELDKVAQLLAAGYATADDVALTVLYSEVEFPADDDGRPSFAHAAPLPVYGGTDRAGRPELPAGVRWRRETGHELALKLPDDAEVLVSPGRFEVRLSGADLFMRAAADAAGEVLVGAIAGFLDGRLDGQAFHRVFAGAHLFFGAPATPGFMALELDGQAVIPVFTSLVELARFAGQTSWASTTGQDLLELLPEGHDLVVDPGTDHALRLRGDALAPVRSA